MIKALVPFADGLEEIEAVTIVDILRRGGVSVVTASIGSSLSVKGAHSIVLNADVMLEDVVSESFDAIVLPGGGEGTENLKKCTSLIERIVRQRTEGRSLAAICAAPTVFSVAGVFVPGQHATCYPTCQMQLDCQWVNQPVVEHGGIITAKAPGSASLFALVVLKSLKGERTAAKIAREMDLEF
jgi:4-methyl-5(b-hydroxyethyl)-thiazole monophosphate biosynthesis